MAKNVDCRRCPRVDIRRATMRAEQYYIHGRHLDACCDKKSAKLRTPTCTLVQFVLPPLTQEALVTVNEKYSLVSIMMFL